MGELSFRFTDVVTGDGLQDSGVAPRAVQLVGQLKQSLKRRRWSALVHAGGVGLATGSVLLSLHEHSREVEGRFNPVALEVDSGFAIDVGAFLDQQLGHVEVAREDRVCQGRQSLFVRDVEAAVAVPAFQEKLRLLLVPERHCDVESGAFARYLGSPYILRYSKRREDSVKTLDPPGPAPPAVTLERKASSWSRRNATRNQHFHVDVSFVFQEKLEAPKRPGASHEGQVERSQTEGPISKADGPRVRISSVLEQQSDQVKAGAEDGKVKSGEAVTVGASHQRFGFVGVEIFQDASEVIRGAPVGGAEQQEGSVSHRVNVGHLPWAIVHILLDVVRVTQHDDEVNKLAGVVRIQARHEGMVSPHHQPRLQAQGQITPLDPGLAFWTEGHVKELQVRKDVNAVHRVPKSLHGTEFHGVFWFRDVEKGNTSASGGSRGSPSDVTSTVITFLGRFITILGFHGLVFTVLNLVCNVLRFAGMVFRLVPTVHSFSGKVCDLASDVCGLVSDALELISDVFGLETSILELAISVLGLVVSVRKVAIIVLDLVVGVRKVAIFNLVISVLGLVVSVRDLVVSVRKVAIFVLNLVIFVLGLVVSVRDLVVSVRKVAIIVLDLVVGVPDLVGSILEPVIIVLGPVDSVVGQVIIIVLGPVDSVVGQVIIIVLGPVDSVVGQVIIIFLDLVATVLLAPFFVGQFLSFLEDQRWIHTVCTQREEHNKT